MIRFIPTAIVALTITFGTSQINFQELSFDEAIKQAKKEDKLLFVDVFAEWCGPCKMLDKNVFSNDALGKKMNESFVSIKIDGDQEESRRIKDSFEINAYPTMLIISPVAGNNRKIEGYIDVETLSNELGYSLDPKTSPANVAQHNYEENQTRENMKEWIEALSNDNGSSVEELYRAMDLFVENYPNLDFEDEIELVIFLTATKELDDPNMQRFIADIENQDPEIVQYAFMQLVRSSFILAKEAADISITEAMIKEAHPLFKDYIDEQLTEKAMLELVEEAFNE